MLINRSDSNTRTIYRYITQKTETVDYVCDKCKLGNCGNVNLSEIDKLQMKHKDKK